jgi:hypothetical protein
VCLGVNNLVANKLESRRCLRDLSMWNLSHKNLILRQLNVWGTSTRNCSELKEIKETVNGGNYFSEGCKN